MFTQLINNKIFRIGLVVVIILVGLFALNNRTNNVELKESIVKPKLTFDIYSFVNEPSVRETGRLTFPIKTNTHPPFNIACFDKDSIICGMLKNSGRWHVFDPQEYVLAHHIAPKAEHYFLDLGSNIGTFALYLAAKGTWKGVAVDPLYGPVIELNQALNNFQPNFKVERVALTSSGSQLVKMKVDTANPGGSFIGSGGNVEVRTATIDDIVAKYENSGFFPRGVVFDYVKMDVEGFEYKSFLGAKRLLEQKRIKLIQMEINPNMLKQAGDSEEALLKLLRDYGYDIYIEADKTSPVLGKVTGHELVDVFAFLRS